MDQSQPEDTALPTYEASKWGIPNWRKKSAYGDVKSWDFFRWRWEFNRRREDLRECFDANAEASFQRWTKYYESPEESIQRVWWYVFATKIGNVEKPPRPDEAGFVAFISDEEVKKFGYFRLPNPRISDQVKLVICPDEDDGTVKAICKKDSETINEQLDRFGASLTPYQKKILGEQVNFIPTPIETNEVAVVFNLAKPLQAQLLVAKRNLATEQQNACGKVLQKRRHPEKWFSYLRTLDARESGASWREISGLHPNTAQTEQTARDIWEAASALRFNF